MKRLSLSLAVVILALSSAVSASDFEEDKQYISCRKGAVNDRQLTACQERLLERLDMSIAKALDRNMTLLAESERITAQRTNHNGKVGVKVTAIIHSANKMISSILAWPATSKLQETA